MEILIPSCYVYLNYQLQKIMNYEKLTIKKTHKYLTNSTTKTLKLFFVCLLNHFHNSIVPVMSL